MRIVLCAMCFLAAGAAAQAQERSLADADLPRGVEARLRAIIENPATRRITGEAIIAERQLGDVVVYDGPLTLTNQIDGQLIVIGGEVRFEAGSAVTSDVTVVDGNAVNLENAVIGGTVTLYGEGFNLFHRGERVLAVNSRTRRVYRAYDHRDWGRSTFALRTGWNYNRVEGLPVQFGPSVETGGRNPTRVEALAIWRTEVSGPFDTENWGYSFRAEQFLGGNRDLRLGAAYRSVIQPIEDWQLSRSEATLATFVLHSDYRDYFEREGWSAYARYAPRATGVSIQAGYSEEDHAAQRARDPWTLFDNDDVWRLQPLVAEGRFRSVSGVIEIDRRDARDFASSGFLLRAEVTRGLGGELAIPAAFAPNTLPIVPPQPIQFNEQFTHGLIDARLYRRVGSDATLSFRVVGGGGLGEHALPPQFQHAMGGAGSLPGYSLLSADCGARVREVAPTDARQGTFFPYYGCDRMAMFSAEYRGGFNFHFGGPSFWDDDDDEWGWHVDASPNWIVFFDAARGWAQPGSQLSGAADTPKLYDVGAGILIGDFGIYGAAPLTGEDRGVKFFVRLGPRF